MKIQEVEINKIIELDNARGKLDVSELMQSIKETGLQQPIGVVKQNGKKQILWGHRRMAAYKKLGFKRIPAVIVEHVDFTEADYYIQNLTENMQRVDPEPMQLAKTMDILHEQYDISNREIAVRVGVSFTRVSNLLRLFKTIPEDMRGDIQFKGTESNRPSQGISYISATYLANKYLDKTTQQNLFLAAKKHNWTVDQSRLISNMMRGKQNVSLKEIESLFSRHKRIRHSSVKLGVNLKELRKYEGESLGSVVRKIVCGDLPHNNRLLV